MVHGGGLFGGAILAVIADWNRLNMHALWVRLLS
jgi:hypothetical protein